jgi:hypothetical protein
MLMYALGRRIESYDQPAIRAVLRGAKHDNYRFSSIVLGIARSVPFQMKGAPAAAQPPDLRAVRLNTQQP